MIDIETVARVRRLFFVEHMKINAISEEIGLHRDTIKRALATETFGNKRYHPSGLDPFRDYILETIANFPRIRAPRMRMLLMDRGYRGSVSSVRALMRKIQKKHRQAYLKLEQMPGEEAQVDWADFGKVKVEGGFRRLSCFVMVLAYSRQMFARFGYDQCLESFLSGHVEAFHFLGGVPRSILYDNLKSAVIERQDGHIRFNKSLMEFSVHFRFHAKACAPYAGNQKGRVERAIRYIRENFFEARPFTNLDDLNGQLDKWRDEIANRRPWPQNRERTVSEAFAEEKGILIPVADTDPETSRIVVVRSGKRPYVQIDGNHYSIPHEFVQMPLTARLNALLISIYSEDGKICEHPRSMAKGLYIEDPAHRLALAESKKVNAVHRDRSMLVARLPNAEKLLPLWLERGENMAKSSQRLLNLLDEFIETDVVQAIAEAINKGSPTIDSIAYLLRTKSKPLPPKPKLNLPQRLQNIEIRSHDPSQYDILSETKERSDD